MVQKMSGERFTPGGEDWENQILEQLAKMFKDMGMPIDTNTLRGMMEQIRSQFDEMGIDPENLSEGKIELNLEATMQDLAKMMGSSFGNKEPITVEVKETKTEEDDDLANINDDDLYETDSELMLTIDVSRLSDLDEDKLELSLTGSGEVLSVMIEGRPKPIKQYSLPMAAKSIEEWSINNGILDLKLTK